MALELKFLVLFLTVFLTAPAWSAVGVVLSVHGSPILQSKAILQQIRMGPGAPFDAGDVVTTDRESSAKLSLIDETILDVHPESKITIPHILDPASAARQVLIEVERGRVRAKVNRELQRSRGKFEIHTQAVVLGVEGTDFVIEVIPRDTQGVTRTIVSVFDGQVALSSPSTGKRLAALGPGMQYTSVARLVGKELQEDQFKPEEIRRLDPSALNALANTSRLANETFGQSIALTHGAGLSGAATLRVISANIKSDPLMRHARTDALFKNKFRNDQFQQNSNYVNVSVGFPGE